MFALMLFYIDGCTSIVDVKKFQTPNATDLIKGQQVNIKFQKQMHKVEILEMSGIATCTVIIVLEVYKVYENITWSYCMYVSAETYLLFGVQRDV